MRPPVVELINRDVMAAHFSKAKAETLVKVIDNTTDALRDILEKSREEAIRKHGTDKNLDEDYAFASIKKLLLSLGYSIAENGGYINEEK